jgi:hypothetical protein
VPILSGAGKEWLPTAYRGWFRMSPEVRAVGTRLLQRRGEEKENRLLGDRDLLHSPLHHHTLATPLRR